MRVLLSMNCLITYDMNMPVYTCECMCELSHSVHYRSLRLFLRMRSAEMNPLSFLKASFYEVSAISSCSNRRSWRYR